MSEQRIVAYMTSKTIVTEEIISAVESERCGAVVTFSGNVRSHDHGKDVSELEYEAHPNSEEDLVRVVNEVCLRHEILNCGAVHRYGVIPIGDAALFIAVGAEHRDSAFRACEELVNQIKLQIPIWKRQTFSDGTYEWVNSA